MDSYRHSWPRHCNHLAPLVVEVPEAEVLRLLLLEILEVVRLVEVLLLRLMESLRLLVLRCLPVVEEILEH